MKRFLLLVIIFILISSGTGREPRRDPETGRIRVLYIGDAWGPTPFFHIEAEPSFIGTPIPATYAHIGTYRPRELKQFMRVYMPRTYDEFADNHDIIILSDTNRDLYELKQLQWFERGVKDDGIGMMMAGGIEAFGGDNYPSWGDSPVEDALPVICMKGKTFRKDFKAVVSTEDNDFVQSLPWKKMPMFHGMNIVKSKKGSEILLEAGIKPHYPLLIYWEYGEGASLAHTPDWTPGWGQTVMKWDYYPDYVANMNYLVAGVDIPENPQLIHKIRNGFSDYEVNKALAVSLMEFVEEFGAEVTPGQDHLDEIVQMKKEAERSFIEQEYEECSSHLDEISGEFEKLDQELVEMKERALFWIYLVEWMAVSGTALVCGFILWTLMIKRRLYREVEITRADH